MPTTRTATIERIDRILETEIARVRLSDGTSIRMNTITVRTLLAHTNAMIEYDVDAVGNRYNPRPAGSAARQAFEHASRAKSRRGR